MHDTPSAAAREWVSGSAEPAPAVEVRQLVKRFRRKGSGAEIVPVDHIDLAVTAGEMVVLLGPSGCGKTTLLRCVAGLERPDEGAISISGRTVFASSQGAFLPPNERHCSMIFQSYALWPHMTVYENVAYPLQARGTANAEIRARVTDTLKLVGLSKLERSHPAQISGGQQQRVALARAFVANSQVVLFDEPLSNVDAKVREQLRLEIRTMQRRFGFSALYVTHDQSEAMAIADRIAVLDDGKIVQLAPPQTIYDAPNSLYVAKFVGAANTWPCRIARNEAGTLWVESPLGGFSITADQHAPGLDISPGAAATVLARPEKLVLHARRPDASHAWQARITAQEFLGPHTEYFLAAGDIPLRVSSPTRLDIEAGAEVWLSVETSSLRLLEDAGPSLPS